MSEQSNLATQIDTVRSWLKAQEPELARALPKGMTPERFTRIALTAVLRNPALAGCTKPSFVLAIMEAAQLGLEPDSVSGLAYMVPFKNVCTLIVGYRGLIQLAYRNSRITEIAAEAVYDKDTFKLRLGRKPPFEHDFSYGPGGRGELIGAYAWARVSGGGMPIKFLLRDEIEAHRQRSRAKDSGPWLTDTAAMYCKTAVRVLSKFIPQSPQLMQALGHDEDPELEPAAGSPYIPSETPVSQILDAIATSGDQFHQNPIVSQPEPQP